jgi:hypothetical protein
MGVTRRQDTKLITLRSKSCAGLVMWSEDVQKGLDVFREVTSDDVDMPRYPARTLLAHEVGSGLKVGSVLALFLMTPVVAIQRKISFVQAWRRVMPFGAVTGLLGANAQIAYHSSNTAAYTAADVDNRVQRLVHDKHQKHFDKFAFVGGVVGAGFGGIFLSSAIVASASTGLAIGTVAYFFNDAYHQQMDSTSHNSE